MEDQVDDGPCDDNELDDDGDSEPSLGSSNDHNGVGTSYHVTAGVTDAEGPEDDLEPSLCGVTANCSGLLDGSDLEREEDEPSLGTLNVVLKDENSWGPQWDKRSFNQTAPQGNRNERSGPAGVVVLDRSIVRGGLMVSATPESSTASPLEPYDDLLTETEVCERLHHSLRVRELSRALGEFRRCNRLLEGRLPRGIGVERLRDAPPEWGRQFEALGLNPQ